MASVATASISLLADTGRLEKTLRTIAFHLNACADDLAGLATERAGDAGERNSQEVMAMLRPEVKA